MTPANAAAVPSLQARLDALYDECGRCSRAWIEARDEAAIDAADAQWKDADERAERTRKALTRAQYGIPYWRFCREARAA